VHYTRVALWLRAVEFLGIIHLAPGEVRRRGGTRCPRYYYGKRGQKAGAFAITMQLTSSQLALLTNGNNSIHADEAITASQTNLSL
jgi:hypothetical protein